MVTRTRREQEKGLRTRLIRLRDRHDDHWSYAVRTNNGTALFQYPAMMVADMQRDLIKALLAHQPDSTGPVFDPFVGSGTVLGAAMELGRDFVGWDINPLAILICKVKAGPLHVAGFEQAADRVLARRRTSKYEERFENWRHWFTEEVAVGLTGLRSAIQREPNVRTRRFLWICLAETVRLTSNSRTSTVKLHRRPAEQIDDRPDPHDVFRKVSRDNLARLAAAHKDLSEHGMLKRGWYQGDVTLRLGDTRELPFDGPSAAVLLTSPPYGDNTSTVPYGQHAYLPLQWIDLADIDAAADVGCLASTYEIDRRSLGGSKRITKKQTEALERRSATLATVFTDLKHTKGDCLNRVVAFMRDFDESLDQSLTAVASGATAAWTVGSRRVGGQLIPLDSVVVELAAPRGFTHVETLKREIPAHRKRMATRNPSGSTMTREHVVVLRRQT